MAQGNYRRYLCRRGEHALTTAGPAGAAVPTVAATRSLGPPQYSSAWAGYGTSGRWFRYVSTTVTVPPQVVPPCRTAAMRRSG